MPCACAHDMTHSMATVPNALPNKIPFIVFEAANEAATVLLELIQAIASPPTLVSNENAIGYQLSLPLSLPDDSRPTGTSFDSDSAFASASRSGLVRWSIGAGPPPALIDKGLHHTYPDILLCTPGKTAGTKAIRRHIKHLHANIIFHPDSGVLLFRTQCNRPVIYEKGDGHDDDLTLGLDEWGKSEMCVLRRERNYFSFGPYRFLLKFVAQTRQNYDKLTACLNEHIDRNYHGLNPSRLFNFIPMPSPYHETSWNVWLHHRIPTTSIIAGVNIRTGQPVAVKKLRNNATLKRQQYIVDRLRFGLQYRNTEDKGILGIVDTWCGHKISPPCLFNTHGTGLPDDCQHTLYSMPLAEFNFLDLPWPKLTYTARLAYFYQTLLGLAELHGQDLFHGNIRPESLLVLADEMHPSSINAESLATKRVVLSLSMSQVEETMTDANSICVPPELWHNKISMTNLNRTKLDIWALAASWLYAFLKLPSNLTVVTKPHHLRLQGLLSNQVKKGYIKEPLGTLLCQMMAWEPQDRPTVTEALASDAWQSVLVERQTRADERKRKRKARIQSVGARRVRVLSP